MSAALTAPQLRAHLRSHDDRESASNRHGLPLLLNVDEAADLCGQPVVPSTPWSSDVNSLAPCGSGGASCSAQTSC